MAIQDIIHAALFCPTPEGFWGMPLFIWGDPGMGKTAMIRGIAHRSGLLCERLSPAERGEGQFGVVPVPTAAGFLSYPAPDWTESFSHKRGLIFLDEANLAPPALQAPLLGLVQLRTLGTYVFPGHTRMLAAANETIDAAGGWDLAPAMANRFGHLNFEGLSLSDWSVGLLGGFATESDGAVMSAEAEEARVLAAWPAAIARARGLVAGFIQKRPALLHAKPQRHVPGISRAWPSRRSVEYAVYALAAATVHNLSDIDTDEFVGAFVGMPWVAEFRTWTNEVDLPDPIEVLEGRLTWKHDGMRVDRTLAVLGACTAIVLDPKCPNRESRVSKCWHLVGSVLDDVADCAIPAARALSGARLYGSKYPNSIEIFGRFTPILIEAGFRS